MATAKKQEQGYNTSDVVLTMMSDEAIALRGVLARISGNPTNSLRVYTDSLANALERAGVVKPPLSGDAYFLRDSNIHANTLPRVRLVDLHEQY